MQTEVQPYKAQGSRFKENAGRVVTLVLDHTAPSEERKMHCMGCGWVLFRYYGSVRIMINGDHNEPKYLARPIEILCGKCKMGYRIA